MTLSPAATIRQAEARDAGEVARIARAAYQVYVEAIGREPAPMVADFPSQIAQDQVTLLCLAEEVAGYVIHFAREDDYFIENIAVDPAFQGQGLGHQLMDWTEARAVQLGQQQMRLYTNIKMTGNIPFYKGRGYQIEEERFEDGFHRIYFVKALA